jgi:hypothetical protein
MTRLPKPGSDKGKWGDILNDYLSQVHTSEGELKEDTVHTGAIIDGAVTTGKIAAAAPLADQVLTFDGSGLTWQSGLPSSDPAAVHLTGDESIAGTKTFNTSPVVPMPLAGSDAANKAYVDARVATISPTSVVSSSSIHSSGKKLKFVMYWPRKSPNMDWWREMDLGYVTWADVENDLDQIKSVLGVNAVRVFTYYDNQFRDNGTIGWTDGVGNHNPVRLAQLRQFIELAASKGLDVIPTMYQLLPALRTTDDWSFLEDDIGHYLSFHTWLLNGIKDYSNVTTYNLLNEPDGYGVWDDSILAGRMLTWLSMLRNTGKQIAPNLACLINSTTHDNGFKRFPTAPVGASSIYELTDVLAHNSFLWADTGYWPGTNYQTQIAYMLSKNILNKPVIMTECGFPANYAQQNVATYPNLNEDGSLAGGNAAVDEESIVPQGGIFDRPKGVATGMSHTADSQLHSVGEAVSIAYRYDLDGLGVWSAYDHENSAAPYVYRDPFGMISKTGVPLPAAAVFKSAFTETYPSDGRHRISLSTGSVSPASRINGLGGFDTGTPANNTPGGVFLNTISNGPQSWLSGVLPVNIPLNIEIKFTIRSSFSAQEPMILRLVANGKQMDWRYKIYTVNSWQRLDTSSGDIDRGFASNSPILGVGDHTAVFNLSSGFDPQLTIDGVTLDYTSDGPEPFLAWNLADGISVVVVNTSESIIDIKQIASLGTGAARIPINRTVYQPSTRQLVVPRILS